MIVSFEEFCKRNGMSGQYYYDLLVTEHCKPKVVGLVSFGARIDPVYSKENLKENWLYTFDLPDRFVSI
jgi:hypothetical protein